MGAIGVTGAAAAATAAAAAAAATCFFDCRFFGGAFAGTGGASSSSEISMLVTLGTRAAGDAFGVRFGVGGAFFFDSIKIKIKELL